MSACPFCNVAGVVLATSSLDQGRLHVDERFAPDGCKVGVNIGAAAGRRSCTCVCT